MVEAFVIALLPATAASATGCSLITFGPDPGSASQYQPYKGTMTTSYGVAPYSYVLASGSSLPPGLSLSKKGIISGVPLQTTAPASATFDLIVTDSASPSPCTEEFQAHLIVFQNSQIPTSDELITIAEGLVVYGPECALAAAERILEASPPDPDCIGVFPF